MRRLDRADLKAAGIILLIAAAATLPILGGIAVGDDIAFHLSRIEGLAGALWKLQIPARIYPIALSAYGYAAPLYYPDIFLLPAACLRAVGVPMTVCYGVEVFLINLASALFMYIAVSSMLSGRKLALAAALLYTFSIYRIYDVYSRAAVGEALAMAFTPLIIAGAYHILAGDARKWPLLCLGMSGVILSHVLSTVMCCLVLVPVFLVFSPKLFRDKRLLALAKAAGLTVLLTCWFWWPFVYMQFNYTVYANTTLVEVESWASARTLSQLFGLDAVFKWGLGGAYQALRNVGFPFFISLVLMPIGWFMSRKDKKTRVSVCLTVIALACILVSSTLFPLKALLGGDINHPLNCVQFVWRFLGLATSLLCVAVCFCVDALRGKGRAPKVISMAFLAFFAFYGCFYLADIGIYRPRVSEQEAGLDRFGGYRDYMPIGAWHDMGDGVLFSSEMYELSEYDRDATVLEFRYGKKGEYGEPGYVDVARLYYPGYTAVDEYGNKLNISPSPGTNVVRVELAEDSGAVSVRFEGLWHWHAATAASVLAGAAVAMKVFLKMKRLKGEEQANSPAAV